jgi:hypothetical protein
MIISPQGFVTTFAPGAGELAGHGGDRSKREGSTPAPAVNKKLAGRFRLAHAGTLRSAGGDGMASAAARANKKSE